MHNCRQGKLECYYCKGEHLIRDCEKFSKDKTKYNLKTTDLAKKYKDKLRQADMKGNITVKEAAFSYAQESTYSVEQAEQLLWNLDFSVIKSVWLDRYITQITTDDASSDNIILYRVSVSNLDMEVLYDNGASISVMSKRFFKKLQNKSRLIRSNRNISGVGGEALEPVGECFITLKIGKKIFRDRVIVIKNLKHNYILGQVLHRTKRFSTCYLTTGRQYITINCEMIAQAISQTINSPILKTKGKVRLLPTSISIVGIKTPILEITNILYELNFYMNKTFQLLEGVISLNVLHRVNNKTQQSLNIPILNTNNSPGSTRKNSKIAMLTSAGKCEEVQAVSWSRLQCNTTKLLPKIPQSTNL